MIQTKNLTLKPVTHNDLSLFQDLLSCPTFTRYLPKERPYRDEEIRGYLLNRIEHWEKGFGTFTVIETQTNQNIGYAGVEVLQDKTKSDIRFGILPSKKGMGYGQEAAKVCLTYTFSLGQHNAIYGAAMSDNIASIKTLCRLGMRKRQDLALYDCAKLSYFSINKPIASLYSDNPL